MRRDTIVAHGLVHLDQPSQLQAMAPSSVGCGASGAASAAAAGATVAWRPARPARRAGRGSFFRFSFFRSFDYLVGTLDGTLRGKGCGGRSTICRVVDVRASRRIVPHPDDGSGGKSPPVWAGDRERVPLRWDSKGGLRFRSHEALQVAS